MDKISIRPITDMDLPFIFSSWLRSYKDESSFAKRIKKDVYFYWHHLMVESILKKPSVRTHIATLDGESDVILGYLISEVLNGEPKIAHYCFVKEHFRLMGIARLLMKAAGLEKDFFITHFTYSIEPLMSKREDITYDPYRII